MKFKVKEDLEPLVRSMREVTPNPKNTREHPKRNREALKNSLKEFGQRKPIVVNKETGYIEAGNALYRAAREFENEEMAMVFVEDSESEAKGFEIADNKTQELSYFEMENLADGLQEIKDSDIELEEVGFNPEEFSEIVGASSNKEEDLGTIENGVKEGEEREGRQGTDTPGSSDGEYITLKFRVDREGQKTLNNVLNKEQREEETRGEAVTRLLKEVIKK